VVIGVKAKDRVAGSQFIEAWEQWAADRCQVLTSYKLLKVNLLSLKETLRFLVYHAGVQVILILEDLCPLTLSNNNSIIGDF